MKKLIFTKSLDDICQGDILHEPNNLNNNTKFYRVYKRNGRLCFFRFDNVPIYLDIKKSHNAVKINFHIVEEVENKYLFNTWISNGEINVKLNTLDYNKLNPKSSGFDKIIATTNKDLELPLFSENLIEFIIQRNGILNIADVVVDEVGFINVILEEECYNIITNDSAIKWWNEQTITVKERLANKILKKHYSILNDIEIEMLCEYNKSLKDIAYKFSEEYVSKNTNFQVGDGHWRARVNMCADVFLCGIYWKMDNK